MEVTAGGLLIGLLTIAEEDKGVECPGMGPECTPKSPPFEPKTVEDEVVRDGAQKVDVLEVTKGACAETL